MNKENNLCDVGWGAGRIPHSEYRALAATAGILWVADRLTAFAVYHGQAVDIVGWVVLQAQFRLL